MTTTLLKDWRTLLEIAQKAKVIVDAIQEQGLHHELPAEARAAIAHMQGVDLSKYAGGLAPADAPHLPGGGSEL